VKVAIPRFGESIAPCFEYSATIAIFLIEDNQVKSQTDFALQSQRAFDRVRLLRDQGVDTLICGGVQDRFEDLVKATGINVISWVSGNVEELLNQFLCGKLHAGTGRL
jgi:predicted Fe-Mo cluster-binding NifX family protein